MCCQIYSGSHEHTWWTHPSKVYPCIPVPILSYHLVCQKKIKYVLKIWCQGCDRYRSKTVEGQGAPSNMSQLYANYMQQYVLKVKRVMQLWTHPTASEPSVCMWSADRISTGWWTHRFFNTEKQNSGWTKWASIETWSEIKIKNTLLSWVMLPVSSHFLFKVFPSFEYLTSLSPCSWWLAPRQPANLLSHQLSFSLQAPVQRWHRSS